jgi:hypothetical protein
MSEGRKAAYYIGGGIMLLGFLLFISNFFIGAMGSSRMTDFDYNPIPGFAFRGVGGMVLMIAGAYIRNVGARGAAGAGLILNPRQAREDLKPWAQTAGGLMKDALDEVKLTAPAPTGEVVKIRCPKCRELNDEDARFCKHCVAAL